MHANRRKTTSYAAEHDSQAPIDVFLQHKSDYIYSFSDMVGRMQIVKKMHDKGIPRHPKTARKEKKVVALEQPERR